MPQATTYVVNNGLTLGSTGPQLTVHHRPPQVHTVSVDASISQGFSVDFSDIVVSIYSSGNGSLFKKIDLTIMNKFSYRCWSSKIIELACGDVQCASPQLGRVK